MNLHEYQGKEILKSFGVAIQEGIVADTVEGAIAAAEELTKQTGTKYWVVKSQIHAGGRGKGKIAGTEQRGVQVAKSMDDVRTITKIFWAMCWLQFKRAMQAKSKQSAHCSGCLLSRSKPNKRVLYECVA
nr:hypothetical protein [Bacteroidota bacterium]